MTTRQEIDIHLKKSLVIIHILLIGKEEILSDGKQNHEESSSEYKDKERKGNFYLVTCLRS